MENNKMRGIVSDLKEMQDDETGTPVAESDDFLVIEKEANGKFSLWVDPRKLSEKYKKLNPNYGR